MNTIQGAAAYIRIKTSEAYTKATSFIGRTVVALHLDLLSDLRYAPAQKIYYLALSIKEELSLACSKLKISPVRTPREIADKFLEALRKHDEGGRVFDGKRNAFSQEIRKICEDIIRYTGIPEANNEANIHFLKGKLSGVFSKNYEDREVGAFAELYFNHYKLRALPAITEDEIKERVATFIEHIKDNLELVVKRAKEDSVPQKIYGPSCNKELTRCEIAKGSDSHNGSQFVCILTYGKGEDSQKICYKPRSLTVEEDIEGAGDSLFSRINTILKEKKSDIELGTLRFLSFENYGYVEFVRYNGNLTSSHEEGIKYARNFGAFDYLCHHLGLADMHAGNYIVRENIPTSTDLESCWILSIILGKEFCGLTPYDERPGIYTNIHAGFKNLSKEEKEAALREGKEAVQAIIKENAEIREYAITIQKKARVRFVPIKTSFLSARVGSDLQDKEVAECIIEELKVSINGRLDKAGEARRFLIEDEEKLLQALIKDRNNMDIPLFTLDADGYLYIRDVRIGYFHGGQEIWKEALSNPVRPYVP